MCAHGVVVVECPSVDGIVASGAGFADVVQECGVSEVEVVGVACDVV